MTTEPLHIVPINDLIEHDTIGTCPCGPRDHPVKQDDGSVDWMVVHHSLDGREQTEPSTTEGGEDTPHPPA